MKFIRRFLFKRAMNNFDLIGIFLITLLAFNASFWFYLLMIPFVFVSAVLDTHFEVMEKLESE
jgi:hypothetical protein